MSSKMKVMLINSFGESAVVDMPAVPRIGGTAPYFSTKGKVTNVCWLPQKITKEIPKEVDVVVTLGYLRLCHEDDI